MTRPTLSTPLCDFLGIEYPILLAGMGIWGMATPPELVAAVSEAGGAGVLGCSGLDPEEIRARVQRVRQLTDKPFGVDLLLPASLAPAATTRAGVRRELEENHPEHVAFMKKLLAEHDLPETPVQNNIVISSEFIEAQIEVVLAEEVPIFAAGLGDPARIVARARAQGMKVLGLTGSVRNAARQVKAGVDVVVAQGTEAGGHTGRIATLPLIPSTIDAVAPTPVVAAGGIVDGRGIAAVLTLGAAGVWLGTAFLVADECGLPDEMKDALIEGRASDFRISEAWTGKTVRSQHNVISQAWEDAELETLPTPHQRVLMEDFLESAKAAKRWDLFMNAAGQGAGALSRRRPAAEIMATLVEDTVAVLSGLSEKVRFAH